MTAARARLLDQLEAIGLGTPPIAEYPTHTTVEEGEQLRADLPGTFTKNLFLKDKKGRLFLLSTHEDARVDLKTLHLAVGAQGRLGFASPNLMSELLGVEPGTVTSLGLMNDTAGTVTPLGLMNDTAGAVTFVIEDALLREAELNFHPMTHTETIRLTPRALLAFLEATGHSAIAVTLTPS